MPRKKGAFIKALLVTKLSQNDDLFVLFEFKSFGMR